MNILALIASLILALLLAGFLYLAWCGLFAKVPVEERDAGPFLLVYKKHTGDYKNIGSVTDQVYYTLRDEYRIETTRGFGLYYDNPQEVRKADLRSIGGCIVDGLTPEEFNRRYPGVSESFGVALFPASRNVMAVHPYRGKASIILGVLRVYPQFQAWMKKYKRRSVPVMEIYDTPSRTITYLAAVGVPDSIYQNLLNQGT
jgi:hypothetical protein